MKRFIVSWGIGALCVGWAVAQPTPAVLAGQNRLLPKLDKVPPILRLAVRNLPNLRFSGTRTVEQFQGAERQVHTEYVLRDGGKTRVWFPTDSPYAGQVIVENLRQRRHYFPGKNEIHVGPAKREEAFGRLLTLVAKGSIKFGTEPGGQIADRAATMLSIRENGNIVQKLWIDQANGMVLRRDLFDSVGGRIGSYEFNEVQFSPKVDAGDFVLDRKGARIVTPADEAREFATRLGLLQLGMPDSEGYALDSVRVIKGARIPILHLSYSRPPNTVSLFQAKGRVELPMLRRANKNGINSFTWIAGGNTFALVGNVEESELKRLSGLLGTR